MAWRKRRPKQRVWPYKKDKMKSKSEVLFATACDERNIKWVYEKASIPWTPPEKKYTPDFDITCSDGYVFQVEYKGYLRSEDITKMLAIRKQYPDLDIRFVFSNADKPLRKNSPTTYGLWATKNGFLYADGFMPKAWLNGKAAAKRLYKKLAVDQVEARRRRRKTK